MEGYSRPSVLRGNNASAGFENMSNPAAKATYVTPPIAESKGLSTAAWIGIGGGVLVALGGAGLGIYFLTKKKPDTTTASARQFKASAPQFEGTLHMDKPAPQQNQTFVNRPELAKSVPSSPKVTVPIVAYTDLPASGKDFMFLITQSGCGLCGPAMVRFQSAAAKNPQIPFVIVPVDTIPADERPAATPLIIKRYASGTMDLLDLNARSVEGITELALRSE